MDSKRVFSPPKGRIVRWLLDCGQDVPLDIRNALIASLFGTLPIFIGGVVNTIGMAALAAARRPDPWFLTWLAMEVLLGLVRVVVLTRSLRAASRGQPTRTDGYVYLALLWAFSVGYGAAISLLSGDWTIAALACLSTAAMAGGICFRNFGAPRLAATMMSLSMIPIALAALWSGELIFLAVLVQIPFYLYSMGAAAAKLNRMLVTTMQAERDNHRRAQHDVLTGLLNRAGLTNAVTRHAQNWGGGEYALFYLDLVGFKQINDSYGHAAGDVVLKTLADRLLGLQVGMQGIAARIGGDEFVLMAAGMDRSRAQQYADRVIDALTKPVDLKTGSPAVGVSIGIAMSCELQTDLSELMARADGALYQAKATGQSAHAFA